MIKTSFHNLAKVITLGAAAVVLGGCYSEPPPAPPVCKDSPNPPHCRQLELMAAKLRTFEAAWAAYNGCVDSVQDVYTDRYSRVDDDMLPKINETMATQCGQPPKWSDFADIKVSDPVPKP